MEWWSGAVVGLRIVTRTGTGLPMVEQTAYQCAGRVMHREAGKKADLLLLLQVSPWVAGVVELRFVAVVFTGARQLCEGGSNGLADPATDGDSKPGEGETDAERGWPYHLCYWRG